MIELKKAIRRKSQQPYDHRGRRLILIVGPGDTIGIKEERCRLVLHVALRDLYRTLLIWRENKIQHRIKQLRKGGLGRREARLKAESEANGEKE